MRQGAFRRQQTSGSHTHWGAGSSYLPDRRHSPPSQSRFDGDSMGENTAEMSGDVVIETRPAVLRLDDIGLRPAKLDVTTPRTEQRDSLATAAAACPYHCAR